MAAAAPATLAVVLERWGLRGASSEPLGRGLVNQTWLIRDADGSRHVLQRVNATFAASSHRNIQAVTEHLAAKGLTTPQLVPTQAGELWAELDEDHGPGLAGVWRLQSAVSGVSFDVLDDAAQARSAGEFVGRWHAALTDLEHSFVARRTGVHDTPRHLARLRATVAEHREHQLWSTVEALARELLAAADALPPMPAVPERPAHGDLKLNNLMFAGSEGSARRQPVALVDLDTVAPMTLGHELGDAWRSWCNRAGEDHSEAAFDLQLFEASLAGWLRGYGRPVESDERRALLLGPEWISLELACRFAADALAERYFGWDAERFASRGEHNLLRARGQWSLHRAALATREARARALGIAALA